MLDLATTTPRPRVMLLDTAASPFTVDGVMNATRLLSDMQRGDADAASQLLNLVQSELRQIAGKLWGEGQPGQTLQPTMLVNKAWERLVGFEGDLKQIVPHHLSGRRHPGFAFLRPKTERASGPGLHFYQAEIER